MELIEIKGIIINDMGLMFTITLVIKMMSLVLFYKSKFTSQRLVSLTKEFVRDFMLQVSSENYFYTLKYVYFFLH